MFIKHGTPEHVTVVKFCKVCGKLEKECVCEKEANLNTACADIERSDKVTNDNVSKTSDSGRHH
jgi:hypothetical protein